MLNHPMRSLSQHLLVCSFPPSPYPPTTTRTQTKVNPFPGIAACNIGGVTIHSFAGIGLGIESAEVLAEKIKKNKKASGRWLRTQVLIIDEGTLECHFVLLFKNNSARIDVVYSLGGIVSMVDGDLFDKLARIGSILRKKVGPFGGIQVRVLSVTSTLK